MKTRMDECVQQALKLLLARMCVAMDGKNFLEMLPSEGQVGCVSGSFDHNGLAIDAVLYSTSDAPIGRYITENAARECAKDFMHRTITNMLELEHPLGQRVSRRYGKRVDQLEGATTTSGVGKSFDIELSWTLEIIAWRCYKNMRAEEMPTSSIAKLGSGRPSRPPIPAWLFDSTCTAVHIA